jgi:hypothetical protein
MKLSDNSIAQIVRLLQVAFLTGTDISDNLRMLQLVEDDGVLEVDPEYLVHFENSLQKMSDEAQKSKDDSDVSGFTFSKNGSN